MNAGDMLYIPPFWFHEVQGQGDSLSVNHWWNSMGLEDMLMKKIDNIASFETATEMPREMAGVVEGAREDNNPGEGEKAPWEYGGASTSPKLMSKQKEMADDCIKERCKVTKPKKRGNGPSWNDMVTYFIGIRRINK